MVLYVVRHAEAEEKSLSRPDEWRHLTEKGRKAVAFTAKAIAHQGPKTRLILTSPLTRTVQTAEIAMGFACRKCRVEASTLLLPNSDKSDLISYLKSCDDKRVMLVGHEPQLGSLVGSLLDLKGGVELAKGGCVALKLGSGDKPAEFLYYLVPGRKPVSSIKKAFSLK